MTAVGWVAFLAAAAAGASLRHVVGNLVAERVRGALPWGTLAVNVSGSLLSGFVTGRSVVLATGFCGAYTTFSTFTYETIRLLEEGGVAEALTNIAATLITCALAAGLGMALASL